MKCYFIFNFSLYQSPSFVYDLFNWRFYKHYLNYIEILLILHTLFNKLSWNKIVVLSCLSVLDNTSSFHAWINSKDDIMVSLKSFLPKFIDQWYTLFPGFYIILYFYPRNITVDVYDVYCPGSPTIKHLRNLEFVPKSSFIFCNDYRCFLDLFYQITSNFIHDVNKK